MVTARANTNPDTATDRDPAIPVMRTKFIKGWPEHVDVGPEHLVTYEPVSMAMTNAYGTDAHFAAYSVPGVSRRLAGSAVFAELEHGVPIVLFVLDVDPPGHTKTPEWWATEREKIDRVFAENPGGYVYCTSKGYRIVYRFGKPHVIASSADASAWKLRYVALVADVQDRYGIVADPACKDWTRLYRLPHVVREGKRQQPETIGNPSALGTWDVEVTIPEHEPAKSRAPRATSTGDARQLAQARAFLAKLPAAIEGELGSTKLLKAAAWMIHGFNIDDSTVRSLLVGDYNPRCVPPWSDPEIDHKITEAREKVDPSLFQVSPAKRRNYHLTEIGNAERLADANAATLRHVKVWGRWLVWDGKRWRRDELGAETTAAKKVIHGFYSDAQEAAAQAAASTNEDGTVSDESLKAGSRAEMLTKWARTSSKASAIAAMVRLAQSESPIAAAASDFDRDLWSFNVLNGTIDLCTGQIRPHDPGDMITRLAPVLYNTQATCPLWDAFLLRVLPDPEVRVWLQRFFGYCLTGSVREHALAFAHGGGSNGKSTAIEVMLDIFGDYARTAAPDLLLAKHGEAHPTEVADLEGARLVVAQEIDEGRHWSVAMMKRLTGGDTIKARHMRQDFYEFAPTHKFVIAGNTRPELAEQGHSVWRRMRLIPFGVKIEGKEKDPDLKPKLLEERAGIFAWLVRGCLDWQKHGLGEAQAIAAATDEYRADQDVLGKWIDERCVLVETAFTKTADLYEDFAGWCKATGRKPWKQDTMKSRLAERAGLSDHRTSVARGIMGLGLQTGRAEFKDRYQ